MGIEDNIKNIKKEDYTNLSYNSVEELLNTGLYRMYSFEFMLGTVYNYIHHGTP